MAAVGAPYPRAVNQRTLAVLGVGGKPLAAARAEAPSWARTTTLSLCYDGGATPSTLSVVLGLPTGYEADAELICVTRREKMQAVDHAVVTAHE